MLETDSNILLVVDQHEGTIFRKKSTANKFSHGNFKKNLFLKIFSY